MKIILKIARAEIKHLFYAPIAWVTILIFFVMTTSQMMPALIENSRLQDSMLENSPSWEGFTGPLTYQALAAPLGTIISYIFLFLPLITMSAINREYQANTISLLTSSPISVRQLVLGKFLGLQLLNLTLTAILAIYLFTGYFVIQHAEFYWYLSILLGVFLFTSVYIAIGLFLSSITTYPLVAVIATFIVLSCLQNIDVLWQQYDLIREITYFLSINGRLDAMLVGLITSKDVFYFVLLSALFLGFTIIKLKCRQVTDDNKFVWRSTLTLVLVVVGGIWLTNQQRFTSYLDVTRDQINTIDRPMQEVLQELDGSPVTVTLYTNLFGKGLANGIPQNRNKYVYNWWGAFKRFYPNINFKYLYYYDMKPEDRIRSEQQSGKTIHELAALSAKLAKIDTADCLKPGEVAKITDMSKEENWDLFLELEYKGKKAKLRQLEVTPGHYPITGTIRRLTRDTTPSILFTHGHFERDPYKYGAHHHGWAINQQDNGESLIASGVDTDTMSPHHRIPENTAILVVADPRSAFSDVEIENIKNFIDGGGNMMIYGEPGKQAMINPILEHIGGRMEDGVLVYPAKNRGTTDFLMGLSPAAHHMSKEQGMQLFFMDSTKLAGTFTTGVATLDFVEKDGFKAEPILSLANFQHDAWLEKGFFKLDSAAPVYAPEQGDVKKNVYNTTYRLTRHINNKEQRIVVAADADFLNASYRGGSIKLGFYSWLLYEEYPVYRELVIAKDTMLSVTNAQVKKLNVVFKYCIPLLIVLGGSLLLIRRQRK